ncbi:MAG: tetrahydromethanopterin S-methyltransferase subunit C [Methanomicrobiaceae archaeon]|nr:tetrahydromethanopterin S-methyltransferase subunit C [Methanomicrobiaceae archaeon]
MSVKIEASEGGRPHNEILGFGLIGSLVCIYLTYLNVLTGTEIFSFFGGLGAVIALAWGSDTIKHLCSYGLGTGVPSAGMIAFGSGVIAMLFATKFGIAAPVAALVIAALLGAVIGYVSDKVVSMNIPVMVISLIELAIVGALTMMGLAAMAGGSFMFADLVAGSTTVFGIEIASYGSSVIGGSVLAVIFILGSIAVQHPFNACLGPGEQQDRTLMLAAECGFLSMIGVAVISFAFIGFGSAVVALLVSIIGWAYTYMEYIKLSRRDAYDWLDAKPIHEPKGGA